MALLHVQIIASFEFANLKVFYHQFIGVKTNLAQHFVMQSDPLEVKHLARRLRLSHLLHEQPHVSFPIRNLFIC